MIASHVLSGEPGQDPGGSVLQLVAACTLAALTTTLAGLVFALGFETTTILVLIAVAVATRYTGLVTVE